MAVASMVKRPPLGTTSWSFIDTKPSIIMYDVEHTHVLTIGNISKKLETEPGTALHSEVFTMKIGDDVIDWCIGICPNGHCEYNGTIGHIAVFLERITDIDTESSIDANLIFHIVDKNGYMKRSKIIDKTISKTDSIFGTAKFISHSELRKNPDLIPEDTLTIMCKVTIKGGGVSLVGGESRSSILVPAVNEDRPISMYMDEMENIYHKGNFPDVTIVCQGKEFPCHKAILAGRSQVFEAMFSPNFKEGIENKVEVVDVAADVLEKILRFIYRGDIWDLKEGAADILVAAEKYALVGLKEMCEESLGVHMTVGNVLDMVELADLHNATMLRAMALRFIGENAKEVSAQKEWRQRIPGVMADIIDAIIQKGH